MIILLFLSFSKALLTVKIPTSTSCQVYDQIGQSQCQSTQLTATQVVNETYVICSSLAYAQLIKINQSLILYVPNYIHYFTLPTQCQGSFIQTNLNLSGVALAISNTSLYIYGGGQNNLYGYLLSDLLKGISTQTVYGSQYITQINVQLNLWDSTTENYTINSNMPQLMALISKQYKFTVSIANDTTCLLVNTPGCLTSPQMVYTPSCNCLTLFYGMSGTSVMQMTWIYYIDYLVWQKSASTTLSVSQNPVANILQNISSTIVGLYADQKLIVYDLLTQEWQQQYTFTIGEIINSYLVFQNRSMFVSATTAYYTDPTTDVNVLLNMYGLKQCNSGWRGNDCNIRVCPGMCFSFLIYPDLCMECASHGTCVNGTCQCDAGYNGTDCSIEQQCQNNCSNFGVCQQFYPSAQCRCNQTLLRGGEDCSVLFCLNNCSNLGTCANGACTCNTGYTGDDCSIMKLDFLS